MSSFLVQIVASNIPNCFGYLSSTQSFPSDASNSFGVFCLTSPTDGKLSVVVQVFGTRPPFAFIHLNAAFMKLHGIQESEQVMLHNVNSVNFCDCIEIMPASLDDWNIIQSTAFVIEEIFLDQIRVVQKGMRFVLNVFDNLSVNFQVISIIPENIGDAPVIVSTTTQVLVVPWEEKKDSKTSQSSSIDFVDSRKFTSNLIDDFVGNFEEKFSRVLPDSLGPKNLNDQFAVPTVIVLDKDPYVKPCVVSLYSPLIDSPCYAIKLAAIKGVNQELDQLQETLERRKGHCWISESVRKMGLKDAMQVKIHPVTKNLINITYLLTEVYDLQEGDQSVLIDSLKNLFATAFIHSPIVMSMNGLYLTIPVKIDGKIRSTQINIQPNFKKISLPYDEKTCFYFWPNGVKMAFEFLSSQTTTQIAENRSSSKIIDENFGSQQHDYVNLAYQEEILTNINEDLIPRFCNQLTDIRILITGSKSSGKTALLFKLAQQFFEHELTIFSTFVNLAEWKGKTDSIEKMLNEKLQILKSRKPSILFIDNLDFLNVHLDDEERKKFVDKIYRKIARILLSNNDIGVIGSATTLRHLPESMISSDSFRIWPCIVEIPVLESNDLHDTLNQLLHCNVSFELKKAESYTVGELAKLAERIRLYASNKDITSEHVSHVFKNIPTAGRRVQNQSDEQRVAFADIGGMRDVKQKLIEVIIWPSKARINNRYRAFILYAELYTRCGIKARNNAILHGPSGCGKSLIMRAIAHEAGLSVITVKGPELLSKYIGSSEENVRKIFERAKNSRPCLVIFDEFDALAPKRGHDNTGVTDRVVNQLLTELDGVDSSLDGIYVLAATNRMDLIDAALLRPGRFDHKIFCDFPNHDERYEILAVLCSELTLSDDVDFHKIVELTTGWTGAELRGLVMNAQFAALESRTTITDENADETVVVTWKEFEKSLSSSKKQHPSIKNKSRPPVPVSSKVTLA